MDHDVEVLLGVVLSNILVGELLGLGHFEWRIIKGADMINPSKNEAGNGKELEKKKLDHGRCMRRDGTTIVRGGGTRNTVSLFFPRDSLFLCPRWRASRILHSGWYDWGVGSSEPAQPISVDEFPSHQVPRLPGQRWRLLASTGACWKTALSTCSLPDGAVLITRTACRRCS